MPEELTLSQKLQSCIDDFDEEESHAMSPEEREEIKKTN